MSRMADTPESKTPEESSRSVDDRTSFSLLILQRVDRVEDEVRDLREEMHQEIGHVRQEIGQLRDEMHQENGQVRQEIGLVRQELRGEISELRQEVHGVTQWGIGIIVALVLGAGGIIVTVLTHHP